MYVLAYLAIHVLCGLLAVRLAGVVDGKDATGAAPLGLLALLGPISLLTAITMWIIFCAPSSQVLERIYQPKKRK